MDLGIKALSNKPRLLEFSNANNVDGITLKQGTADDVELLIAFLNDEKCTHLWDRVEGIEIGHITSENSELIKELVDLLASKCPKLKSFSCRVIYYNAKLTLPKGLTNLKSFSCKGIGKNAKLRLPKELPMLRWIYWGKYVENLEILQQLQALKAQFEARGKALGNGNC